MPCVTLFQETQGIILLGRAGAKLDIVIAALHNGGCGNQSQLGISLQIGDIDDTAVAHGGLDLV